MWLNPQFPAVATLSLKQTWSLKQTLQDSNTLLILHMDKQILTFELDVGFSEL